MRLFAEGFVKSDVVRVASHLPTTERFRDKVLPSCITPDVMAIALGELEGQTKSAWGSGLVGRVEAAGKREPAPLGAVLGGLVAAGGEK